MFKQQSNCTFLYKIFCTKILDTLYSVEMLPEHDLLAAFNSDDVITDEHGDLYLAGPLMAFKVD